ncbi:MAG TPA: universal stress protein [Solirubrobacteraceae bacterium]|nr:universal stress protein [Solirubrobacteraceae bacterium]
MFDHVLVGVDGAEGGRDAIALAKRLSHGGRLTFGAVYRDEPLAWRGSSAAFTAAQRERAEGQLKAALEEAGVDASLRWHGAATVGRGLHELAEATGADLLVIGSSRRGIMGRVLLGDDTRNSINGAPCAVAVAPAGYAGRRGELIEIGVGYDGSPESEHALTVARALAEAHGSRLSAFEAVHLPAYMFTGPPMPDEATITAMIEEAREQVDSLQGVEGHAAYGSAAEELTVFSASLDLLVIGSRSYGPVGRIVHGSTAQDLARRCHCPLLVLTRSAREADAAREARATQETLTATGTTP